MFLYCIYIYFLYLYHTLRSRAGWLGCRQGGVGGRVFVIVIVILFYIVFTVYFMATLCCTCL